MSGLLWWLPTLIVLAAVAWLVLPQLIGLRRARAGDYAAAERWYRLSPTAGIRMSGSGNIAVAQIFTGRLEEAEPRLRQVFEFARRRRDHRLELHTLVNLGACLIAQRRLREAAPLLAWVARDPRARPRQRASALYNLAWISYLEFDFEAAARGLAAARLEAPRPGGGLPALYELMAGRLAARSGDWEGARRHLDEAAAHAGRFGRGLPGQVALSRGLMEYLAGNRGPGLELVLGSAAGLQAADRGDLAGRTMLGLAYLARRQGDEASAAKLEAAAARFRGLMPMPSAEDCASYLRPPAARD